MREKEEGERSRLTAQRRVSMEQGENGEPHLTFCQPVPATLPFLS